MVEILKYIDETDKSLGIAGMAISMVATDCEDILAAVSLEEGEEAISLRNEFFFGGNPRLSAKIAWQEMLRQFNVTTALLMGNVFCRRLCAGRSIDSELLGTIHDIVVSEAAEHCSLDADEAENLYNRNCRYYHRLFSHAPVVAVARDFATTLRMQRRMSVGEVLDNLRRLTTL